MIVRGGRYNEGMMRFKRRRTNREPMSPSELTAAAIRTLAYSKSFGADFTAPAHVVAAAALFDIGITERENGSIGFTFGERATTHG